MLDSEHEGATGNEPMRYRIEQQRKGSIPNNNNQAKTGSENKVNERAEFPIDLIMNDDILSRICDSSQLFVLLKRIFTSDFYELVV